MEPRAGAVRRRRGAATIGWYSVKRSGSDRPANRALTLVALDLECRFQLQADNGVPCPRGPFMLVCARRKESCT